jgi:hypothetical protein
MVKIFFPTRLATGLGSTAAEILIGSGQGIKNIYRQELVLGFRAARLKLLRPAA